LPVRFQNDLMPKLAILTIGSDPNRLPVGWSFFSILFCPFV
jgi:hypothetical protein